jgi:hypothetical protein
MREEQVLGTLLVLHCFLWNRTLIVAEGDFSRATVSRGDAKTISLLATTSNGVVWWW